MTHPPYQMPEALPVAKPKRPGWVVPVVAVLVVLVAGLGAAAAWLLARPQPAIVPVSAPAPVPATSGVSFGDASKNLTGTFTLYDDGQRWKDNAPCTGKGGFADIQTGAQVKVSDPTGKLLALGELKGPSYAHNFGGRVGCLWVISIDDVPTGRGFYGIEISHRGVIQYPESEVFAALGVDLTLGENS